jgi:hypothetical protein
MLDDEKLTPADPRELVIALSLGLTAKPPLAQHQAAETMAKIVAERLASQGGNRGRKGSKGGVQNPSPLLPFEIGPTNGREGRGSGLSAEGVP